MNKLNVTDGEWFCDDSCFGSPFIDSGDGSIVAQVYEKKDANLIAQSKVMYDCIDCLVNELRSI